MKRQITNLAGFPEPVYRALSSDNYVGGGDISVTRIISPPRIVALRRFHEEEIVEDASSRIWSVLGQAGHKVLELSADEESTVEERLIMPFDGLSLEEGIWRWKVSGQPDLYYTKKAAIYDYKFTSVWSVLHGEKPEWERQINLQAMLHRNKGDEVREGYIIAFLRDWSVRKARFEKDYPSTQAKTISIPLWTQEEAIEYTLRRVKVHQKAQLEYEKSGLDPNVLPMCSDEERWYRGHAYAVKKMDKNGKINKKADRLLSSMTDAIEFMDNNRASLPKGKQWAPVEERPGENIRCLDYCDVWNFCPFGRSLRENAVLVNEKKKESPQGELGLSTEEEED